MRVYSEQEVSQILERAVERQARSAQTSPAAGLTLGELEKVAGEVGIDVAHLRAAAAEVDAAGGVSQRRTRSASHIFVERWVAGTLSDEAWDDIVAELQNRFGKSGIASMLPASGTAGTVQQVGRNREWVHTDGLGVETRVLASGRGDRVRLRLSQRVGIGTPATDGTLIGIGLGWIPGVLIAALAVAKGNLDGPLAIPIILLSMLLVGLFTVFHDRRWRARKHDQLDQLAEDLADLIAEPAPSSTTATTTREADARVLSLDTLEDPEPHEASETRGRTRA